MGVFTVQHFFGDGRSNPRHYLSFLSPVDWSVRETLDLPFDVCEGVGYGSCGELLYFQGDKGTSAVCNLATQEIKFLPPPNFDPPPHWGMVKSGCLGYDATSDDYKVIRKTCQYRLKVERDGVERNFDHKQRIELYSFKSGSWKEIKTPATKDAAILDVVGVYLAKTGSAYFKALLETSFGGSADEPCQAHVLSFDFATEMFNHFPLPRPSVTKHRDSGNYAYRLVECRGSLGALVYWRLCDPRSGQWSASPLCVELYVWQGSSSLDMLYSVTIANVEAPSAVWMPLGLRDGHLLILETTTSSQVSQVMAYDLQNGKSKKLNIYDRRGYMSVHSYVESTKPLPLPLPDSKPIALIPYVESTDPLPLPVTVTSAYNSSEDEEERKKVERRWMRMGAKTKSKSKREREKAKSKRERETRERETTRMPKHCRIV